VSLANKQENASCTGEKDTLEKAHKEIEKLKKQLRDSKKVRVQPPFVDMQCDKDGIS
jgi:hypothetical protein